MQLWLMSCTSTRGSLTAGALALGILIAAGSHAVPVSAAGVNIKVVDEEGQPLPCRIHIKNDAGQPQRAGQLPFFRDHFSCGGTV